MNSIQKYAFAFVLSVTASVALAPIAAFADDSWGGAGVFDGGGYVGGYDGGGYLGDYGGYVGGYDDGGYLGGYDGDYYGGYADGGYVGGYDGGGYIDGKYYDDVYGTYYDDVPGTYYDDVSGTYYDDYYAPGYNYGGSFGGGSYGMGYGTGCGYFCGGTTYTTPGCTGCGGFKPTPKPTPTPPVVIPQGGGSQSQSQSQTSNNNNTNTNTNVNVNNNTAIAVVQVGAQTAQQPTYPTYPTTPVYPAPYCSIYQAQSYATGYGTVRPVYLSWSSSNAQSAYLSNYGSVSANGSQTVYPTYSTTYTLTVYGYNGQQATCQVTVYANTYTYTPPVPTTPYVSLTQIPYTGFDFGPVGNAMYWAGLAILALGGAYLAVYFIPQLAFARGSYQRTFSPVVAPKAPILLEREAADAKVASIVETLRKNGTSDSMAIVHVKGSMPRIVVDRS